MILAQQAELLLRFRAGGGRLPSRLPEKDEWLATRLWRQTALAESLARKGQTMLGCAFF
jgi:hypothetical protein